MLQIRKFRSVPLKPHWKLAEVNFEVFLRVLVSWNVPHQPSRPQYVKSKYVVTFLRKCKSHYMYCVIISQVITKRVLLFRPITLHDQLIYHTVLKYDRFLQEGNILYTLRKNVNDLNRISNKTIFSRAGRKKTHWTVWLSSARKSAVWPRLMSLFRVESGTFSWNRNRNRNQKFIKCWIQNRNQDVPGIVHHWFK